VTRYLLRRLAVIPIGMLLAHFAGFAYAHLVLPIQLANHPMFASTLVPDPLIATYAAYWRGVMSGDFGSIPPAGAPVLGTVASAALASFVLLALALLIALLIGVPLGIKAVRSNGGHIAPWLTALTTAGLAMPGFYIGSLLIMAALWYNIYGPSGAPFPVQGPGFDLHLVLPTLVLAARPTAQIAQVTASLMAAEMDKQHIVTARSVGNSWRRIRRKHAFRNMIAPLAIAVFAALRLTVGELIIVEWIFSWPGLGRLLALILIAPMGVAFDSPLFLHPPTLGAVLAIFAALFLVGDLASGLTARLADPALRADTHGAEEVASEA
jgi:ABC-type dipeptide/oligopeptide/nickel transport system permease component